MSELVFAFGSNMSSARFRDYKVSPEGAGSAAVLEGHRLVFNKASKDGSGKASVEAQEGSHVWGVLYKIPSDAISVLDNGEGRGYRRVQLPVRIAGTDVAQAWVYLAAKPSTDPELRPYAWYTNYLVEGAREHGKRPLSAALTSLAAYSVH